MSSILTLGGEIDALAETIAQKAQAGDAGSSYTVALLDDGVARCAKKFGEEAVEAAIAAASGDHSGLVSEAADVIYHLLVLLQAAGVPPEDVAEALANRKGVSGHVEKASRKRD